MKTSSESFSVKIFLLYIDSDIFISNLRTTILMAAKIT